MIPQSFEQTGRRVRVPKWGQEAQAPQLVNEWTWSGPERTSGSPELRQPLLPLIWTHTLRPSPARGPLLNSFGQLPPCDCLYHLHSCRLFPETWGSSGDFGGNEVGVPEEHLSC